MCRDFLRNRGVPSSELTAEELLSEISGDLEAHYRGRGHEFYRIRAYEPLAEASAKTWERILAVNLLSYAWFIKAAIADLRTKRGNIVNISSTHAVNARAGMGQYDVTKAGIVSLTKTLAFEEAKHGVRVNAVCPGATLTPFHLRRAAAAGRTQRELEQDAKNECLMERWADPREVAFPILWLASDEASYITGSVLMVDGGRYVK